MNQVTGSPAGPARRSGGIRRLLEDRRVAVAAAIVVVAAVVLVAWLLLSRDDSSGSAKQPAEPVKPVALSESGLKTLAGAVEEPIYWAGAQKGFMYELRRTANGSTYVRYLPRGVKAGAGGARYLTIATYPFPDALDALEKVAGGKGIDVPGGGVALVSAQRPMSVHLAFPDVDYQVEVFDPSPERAREIAASGNVRPAG